jgi:pilus assembly protein Flp/PilA
MSFAPKEKGLGLVEYALILVLVAVVIIAVLLILKPLLSPIIADFLIPNAGTATP